MITLISVFFGGVVSALVTLWVGQPLQHYFWRRQRHAERQFAIIDEVNKMAAEFRYRSNRDPHGYKPTEEFNLALQEVTAKVKVLFSESAFNSFTNLDKAIQQAELRPTERPLDMTTRLQQAHDTALKALYKEVGIPAPSLGEWFQVKVCLPLTKYGRETLWPKLTQVRRRRG